MIKTGINYDSSVTPKLLRMLLNHPDIELKWVAGMPGGLSVESHYDELRGELPDNISSVPDYTGIDLYIGIEPAGLDSLMAANPKLKAIITDAPTRLPDEQDTNAAVGIAELNRKTLVRGARIAYLPDVITLLGALALMPLGKNLMLNAPIFGTMLLPAAHSANGTRVNPNPIEDSIFAPLRNGVLTRLQSSFNSPMRVTAFTDSASYFAAAIFDLDCKTSIEETIRLYHLFYDDHRHIVITDGPLTEAMVMGTNKTVLSLSHDPVAGRLSIAVAFDASFKAKAGAIVHLLDLMFGLDEKTGF